MLSDNNEAEVSNLNPDAQAFIHQLSDFAFLLQPERTQTPKSKHIGPTPKSALLKKQRSCPLGNIADFLIVSSRKRSRDGPLSPSLTKDNISPPNKVSRASSSPPSAKLHKVTDLLEAPSLNMPIVDNISDNTQSTMAAQLMSLDAFFKQLQTWCTEDQTNLAILKQDVIKQISDSSDACHSNISKLRADLSAENETIMNELAAVKARISKLESDAAIPAADGTTVRSLEERVISATINSVEKRLRKNNIIISVLKAPYYINHDLTPEESNIAKKLRDEDKKLRAKGHKIKQGFQKLYRDGTPMSWDASLEFWFPVPQCHFTHTTAKTCFWNARGRLNIPELTANSDALFIGITEIWATKEHFSNPPLNSNKNCFYVPAIKPQKQGRPSGGLAIFTDLKTTIIAKSEHWIISRVLIHNMVTIIAVIYFKPNVNLMGNFGHLPEEALEYTNFTGKRTSLDLVCNHQGKILAQFMAENGFILLNGRSPGDPLGDFTFSGPLGNSTVDFIWVDVPGLHLVGNMWVDNLITGSDHFPITISLLLSTPLPVNNVWSEDRQSNITK
ncbi:hypothetical protein KQX54_020274 [Cotesia glomerata]|uniref:Endonuclease/exonuclease/phosphatase domain-containing protein n=1 Tax=Cotesia glomerata TaxID=32391 RepID=A0AAV7ISB9_COTGL|nr:hypothetical protein KQX54_020274 [Cotesia glomerata]